MIKSPLGASAMPPLNCPEYKKYDSSYLKGAPSGDLLNTSNVSFFKNAPPIGFQSRGSSQERFEESKSKFLETSDRLVESVATVSDLLKSNADLRNKLKQLELKLERKEAHM